MFPPFVGLPDLPAIATLQVRPQWVAWSYVLRSGAMRCTKPPVNPHAGRGASHSDRSTWGTYQEAAVRAEREGLPGVGFVLAGDDGIGGFDLDKVRDPETGTLVLWAADVLAFAETYAEVSPSGAGVRIFAAGKPEKAVKSDPAGVEVYGEKRFMTVTGQHV